MENETEEARAERLALAKEHGRVFEATWAKYRDERADLSFFEALCKFTGYSALYGKRRDGAFDPLEQVPLDKFPNTN